VGGDRPKVLLPVEGRPFLAHVLDYLRRQGIEDAVLCLGHGADEVWTEAQRAAPAALRLRASRETEPLGTGGALRLARGVLGSPFFAVNGDTYVEAPLAALLDLHRRSGAAITLSLVRSERAAEKGTVRIDGEGRVLEFAEKTTEGSGFINAGVYVLEADLLDGCPEGVFASLEREVIPDALARGRRAAALVVDAPFVDIGLPEDYLRVRDRLARIAP
jgi:NDP-sugar pyrophosphorylase family protein